MKEKLWRIHNTSALIPESFLRSRLSPLLASVLAIRGFTDIQAVRRFLFGGDELFYDPMALPDMAMARDRVRRAIRDREHVAVYGDYDVDGITSSCVVADYLRRRGLTCEVYIPDRIGEGYGVNCAAVDKLAQLGVTLIITVDCGITAVEETEYAARLGIDMVITDHHECRETLPRALAVVDSKRPGVVENLGVLAGVGVAFKLLCAVDGDPDRILEAYSDLVMIGTVADVMPFSFENRDLIRAGLDKTKKRPRLGLAALMDEVGLTPDKLNPMGISFSLAPKLNAAGRLGQAQLAVELLLSTDRVRCRELAETLCRMNKDRQALESDIWNDALALVGDTVPDGPLVLAGEDWHQGVIGIVASRLADTYSVPTVMISLEDDHGKGSCRSFGGFNLFDALSACSAYLENFGGHVMAGGLNIRRENIDAFRQALTDWYRAHPGDAMATLDIDLEIHDPEMLSIDCVESLTLLEPCGSDNPRPMFCILGATLESAAPIGGGRHVRMRVSDRDHIYDCVYFQHTAEELGLRPGDRLDLAFFAQINEFRQRRSVQLVIQDIRKPDYRPVCRRILAGHMEPEDYEQGALDRSDFARLWRRLEKQPVIAGPVDEVLARLSGPWDANRPVVCACLKVMAELKLIDLTFDGTQLDILCHTDSPKVSLFDSALFRRMRTQNET